MTRPDERCAVCKGRLLPEAQITGGPPRHEDATLQADHWPRREDSIRRWDRLGQEVSKRRAELLYAVRDVITVHEQLDEPGRMQVIRDAYTALVDAEERLRGGER